MTKTSPSQKQPCEIAGDNCSRQNATFAVARATDRWPSSASKSPSTAPTGAAAPPPLPLMMRRPFKKRMRQFQDSHLWHRNGDDQDEAPPLPSQQQHQEDGSPSLSHLYQGSLPSPPLPRHDAATITSRTAAAGQVEATFAATASWGPNAHDSEGKSHHGSRRNELRPGHILQHVESKDVEATIARADSTATTSSGAAAALVTPPRLERQTAAFFPTTVAHTNLLLEQTSAATESLELAAGLIFVVDPTITNRRLSSTGGPLEHQSTKKKGNQGRGGLDDVDEAALHAPLSLFEDYSEILLSPMSGPTPASTRPRFTKTSDVYPFEGSLYPPLPLLEEGTTTRGFVAMMAASALAGEEPTSSREATSSVPAALSEMLPLVVDTATMKRMMMALAHGDVAPSKPSAEEAAVSITNAATEMPTTNRNDSTASSMDISALREESDDDDDGDEKADQVAKRGHEQRQALRPSPPRSPISIGHGDLMSAAGSAPIRVKAGTVQVQKGDFESVLEVIISPIQSKRRRGRTFGRPDVSWIDQPSSPATITSRKSSLSSSLSSRVTPTPTRMKMTIDNLDGDEALLDSTNHHHHRHSRGLTVNVVNVLDEDDDGGEVDPSPPNFALGTGGDTPLVMPLARQPAARALHQISALHKSKNHTSTQQSTEKKTLTTGRLRKGFHGRRTVQSNGTSPGRSGRNPLPEVPSPAILSQLEEEQLMGVFHSGWDDLDIHSSPTNPSTKSSVLSSTQKSLQALRHAPSEVPSRKVLAKLNKLGKSKCLTGTEKVNEMHKLLTIPSRKGLDNVIDVCVPASMLPTAGAVAAITVATPLVLKGGQSRCDKHGMHSTESRLGTASSYNATTLRTAVDEPEATADDCDISHLFQTTGLSPAHQSHSVLGLAPCTVAYGAADHAMGLSPTLAFSPLHRRRHQETSNTSIAPPRRMSSQRSRTSTLKVPPSYSVGPFAAGQHQQAVLAFDGASAFNVFHGSVGHCGIPAVSNFGSAFSRQYGGSNQLPFVGHPGNDTVWRSPLTHRSHIAEYQNTPFHQMVSAGNGWNQSFLLAATDSLVPIGSGAGSTLTATAQYPATPNAGNMAAATAAGMRNRMALFPFEGGNAMKGCIAGVGRSHMGPANSPSKVPRRVSDPDEEHYVVGNAFPSFAITRDGTHSFYGRQQHSERHHH